MTKAETEALQVLFNHYMVSDRRLEKSLCNDDYNAIVEALDNKQVAYRALLELGIDLDYEYAEISKRGKQKAINALNAADSKVFA